MASRGQVAAAVAESKRKHPEAFCPVARCLWRTNGNYARCPRHPGAAPAFDADAELNAAEAAHYARQIAKGSL